MAFPVRTNIRAQNAFRAPGVVEGITVLEQAMDELAAALGIDPLELRRTNHVDRDQARAALLEQAAARLLRPRRGARRLERTRALREPQADGLLRGMGCATQIWWGGGGPPAHATVRLDADGRALVVDRDPGHRHRHADHRAHRRRRGARPPLEHVSSRGGDTGRTSTARWPAAR